MLLATDVGTGRALYGLGANTAAVRCIAVLPAARQLAVTGDDGGVIFYSFAKPEGGGGSGSGSPRGPAGR